MKINMYQWLKKLRATTLKKAVPVLSFPSVQLLDITVKELILSSGLQAQGMKKIADLCETGAALSMMDLSVEAEAFGSKVQYSDHEVPTVIGSILNTPEDVRALAVPQIGAGRTGIYIEAIEMAARMITDRPVFAGCIGPFSLAGRMMDMSQIMMNCYDEPEMVQETLEKTTEFIIEYCKAFKAAGANGIVLAEPAAGLLSPALIEKFSSKYVKQIIQAVEEESFIVVYHNCGNVLPLMESIIGIGAKAYHFGNAVNMAKIMKRIPYDVIAMGNIDPAGEIRHGIPKSITQTTLGVMKACCKYDNFVISTGCDIPPLAPWTNIDAFFEAVSTFNEIYAAVLKFNELDD